MSSKSWQNVQVGDFVVGTTPSNMDKSGTVASIIDDNHCQVKWGNGLVEEVSNSSFGTAEKIEKDEEVGTIQTDSPSIKVHKAQKKTFCRGNIPKIMLSVTSCLIMLAFGAMIGSLSAAIPEIATEFDEPEASVGELFTARGAGYAAGAVITGFFLNRQWVAIDQIASFVLNVLVFCACIVAMARATDLDTMMVLVGINAITMGYFDTYCCFLLSEVWGGDVGPWMQALFAVMGVGQVVGPTFVGLYGYRTAFTVIAASCALPLISVTVKLVWDQRIPTPVGLPEDDTVGYTPLAEKVILETVDEATTATTTTTTTAAATSAVASITTTANITDDNVRTSSVVSDTCNGRKRMTMLDISRQSTLSLGHDEIADAATVMSDAKESVETPQILLQTPTAVKFLLFFYYWSYLGMEIAYSGWIGTFALDAGLTDSSSKAAYLVSIFYLASTIGRISAVPISVYFSNTAILGGALSISMCGALITLVFAHASYGATAAGAAVLGFGFSSIFSLGMTLPVDYGCTTLDSDAVSGCILGGAAGDATLPLIVGLIMNKVGYTSLPFSILIILLILWSVCLAVHLLLTANKTQISVCEQSNESTTITAI